MPRIATSTIGQRNVRRAFRTHGHGVVRTSRADNVAAVSARETRNAALRSPCAVTAERPKRDDGRPGVRKIAGSAIVPVKNRTGSQTHAGSLRRRTRDSNASSNATTNIAADDAQFTRGRDHAHQAEQAGHFHARIDSLERAAGQAICSALAAYSEAASRLAMVRSMKLCLHSGAPARDPAGSRNTRMISPVPAIADSM